MPKNFATDNFEMSRKLRGFPTLHRAFPDELIFEAI